MCAKLYYSNEYGPERGRMASAAAYLPLLVDRTKTLLEIFDAYRSDARDLLRLVILLIFVVVVDFNVAAGQVEKCFL